MHFATNKYPHKIGRVEQREREWEKDSNTHFPNFLGAGLFYDLLLNSVFQIQLRFWLYITEKSELQTIYDPMVSINLLILVDIFLNSNRCTFYVCCPKSALYTSKMYELIYFQNFWQNIVLLWGRFHHISVKN